MIIPANDTKTEADSLYNEPAIVTGHLTTIILTYWTAGIPATVHGALTASPRLRPETAMTYWGVAHNAAKFIAASINLQIPKPQTTGECQ